MRRVSLSIRLGHERTVEGGTRLITDHEAQQVLGLCWGAEVGAVTSAVLQAVRHEDLSDDLAIGVLHHPKTDLQLTLMDVESDSRGAAQQEPEGIKRSSAFYP